MTTYLNINRSGRACPHSAGGLEIDADASADKLTYDVYLISSQACHLHSVSPEAYLAGSVADQVYALLCVADSVPDNHCEAVRFVAEVLGLSQPIGGDRQGDRTISMRLIGRPGQADPYAHMSTYVKYNVTILSFADASGDTVFRPSIDAMQLMPNQDVIPVTWTADLESASVTYRIPPGVVGDKAISYAPFLYDAGITSVELDPDFPFISVEAGVVVRSKSSDQSWVQWQPLFSPACWASAPDPYWLCLRKRAGEDFATIMFATPSAWMTPVASVAQPEGAIVPLVPFYGKA